MLSAFLDNAPTYLVFFELAGGDAQTLMGPLAPTLAAISMGAVYMGALTYIGNAPNFMVYAIADERGIADAELLRLYALGGADPAADLCADHNPPDCSRPAACLTSALALLTLPAAR